MNQVFTLKHLNEKIREKRQRVILGSTDLKKLYDRVNGKVIWNVLRVYNVNYQLGLYIV